MVVLENAVAKQYLKLIVQNVFKIRQKMSALLKRLLVV